MKNHVFVSLMLLASSVNLIVMASDDSLVQQLYPLYGETRRYPQLASAIDTIKLRKTPEQVAGGGSCHVSEDGVAVCVASTATKVLANLVLCDEKKKQAILVGTSLQYPADAGIENTAFLSRLSTHFKNKGYEKTMYHRCGRMETNKHLDSAKWQPYQGQDTWVADRMEQLFGTPYCSDLSCARRTPCVFHPSEAVSKQ